MEDSCGLVEPARHRGDTTPPKRPAFPSTCKGAARAQVAMLEEVICGGGGKADGVDEVAGAGGGLAVADTTGGQFGRDRVAVEERVGGMPRPPEHLTGKTGGCFDAGGGTDEHSTKFGCKSEAIGCSNVCEVIDGSIVAIEEVKGGLPRPPELAAGGTCLPRGAQIAQHSLTVRPISPLRPLALRWSRVVLRQLRMARLRRQTRQLGLARA